MVGKHEVEEGLADCGMELGTILDVRDSSFCRKGPAEDGDACQHWSSQFGK